MACAGCRHGIERSSATGSSARPVCALVRCSRCIPNIGRTGGAQSAPTGSSEILDQKVSCGDHSKQYGDNDGSPHQGFAPAHRSSRMPIARCTDCGQGRRYKRPPAEPRCKPCYRLYQLYLEKSLRDERKRKKLCALCGDGLSPHSIFHCVACGAYHAGYQARAMREKRDNSPAYREDERIKVRARMRTIRAERRKAGINTWGQPYKSATWQRKAVDREGILAS